MSQAVPTELDHLSIMCLKVYNYSIVAMGAHSERPCEISTSSRRRDVKTNFQVSRKFGLFCSTWSLHEYQRHFLVYVGGQRSVQVQDYT